MLLANVLRRAQARSRTRPEDPRQLGQFAQVADLVRKIAGVRVTVEEALQVSVFWACIDVISKALAASEWNIYRRLPRGDWDLLPDDSTAYVLNTRPNPEMTAINFRQGLLICALACGNGYAEIVRDGAGRLVELWPLMSDRTEPFRDTDGQLRFLYRESLGEAVILEASQVFHLAGPGITGFVGDNTVAKAARSVALAIAAQKFSASYFGNGVSVSGVFEYGTSIDDPTYDRLKKQIEDRYSGPEKALRPMLLEGGMKWTQIGSNAKDAMLIEAMKFQVEEICRWFGVPPHMVGHLERATFNNIEHLGIEFVRNALTPWARRADQEADYKLFPARGPAKFTRHDIEWLSQGDAKARAEAYQLMRRMGVYTVNDILKLERRNTIGADGDIRIVEQNMVRLEQVGMHVAPAEPPSNQVDEPAGTEPEQEDNPPRPVQTLRANVREAAVMLLGSVYQTHVRKVENRVADLQARGKTDMEVETHVADMRDRERARVHKELLDPCAFIARTGGVAVGDVSMAAFIGLDDAFARSPSQAAASVVDQFIPR